MDRAWIQRGDPQALTAHLPLISAGPYPMGFLQAGPPAGPGLLTSRPLLCLAPLSQQPQLHLLIPAFYTPNHLILVYNMRSCRAPHLIGSSVSHAIKMLSGSSQILLDILCERMLKKRVCSFQFIWSSTFSSAPRDDVREAMKGAKPGHLCQLIRKETACGDMNRMQVFFTPCLTSFSSGCIDSELSGSGA